MKLELEITEYEDAEYPEGLKPWGIASTMRISPTEFIAETAYTKICRIGPILKPRTDIIHSCKRIIEGRTL